MKALWNAIAIVLLINLLALVGGVVWLYAADRLNDERVREAASVFQITLAEEEHQYDQLQLELRAQEKEAEQMRWLEDVRQGPVSVAERLARDKRAEEVAALTLERARDDRKAWLTAMTHYQRQIEATEARVKAQREELERLIAQQTERGEADGFRKAVQMYEQAPPKLAKQMLLELLAAQKRDQVVQYLAAMQVRKAADVLREFKTPAEVQVAADLIEGLRLRGVNVLSSALDAAGGGS